MDDRDGDFTPRPLFITSDAQLRQRLRELAATAGCHAWEVADAVSAWRYWGTAASVTIGPDAAEGCAAEGLPPRSHVILLAGDGLSDANAWDLAQRIGAGQVASLPHATGWLAERLLPHTTRPHGKLIVVTNARGGAGASTLAAGLAVHAARHGRRSILIDSDTRGGGLDTLLGWESRKGLRWSDIASTVGPYDPRRLRARLPGDDNLGVLTFDRDRHGIPTPATAQAVVSAARRACDLVVVDLPRFADPWMLGAVAGGDLLVAVVPGQLRAIPALRRVIGGYAGVCDRARLVVRRAGGKVSPQAMSSTSGIPVAAVWRDDRRFVARAEKRGLARCRLGGRLNTVCHHVAAETAASPPAPGIPARRSSHARSLEAAA